MISGKPNKKARRQAGFLFQVFLLCVFLFAITGDRPGNEDVVDDVHRIGDINNRIAVDLARFIRIWLGRARNENIIYNPGGIGNINESIRISISA